jgi:hypothetical protein
MRKKVTIEHDLVNNNILVFVDGIKQKLKYTDRGFEGKFKELFDNCNPPIMHGNDEYQVEYRGTPQLFKNGYYVASVPSCNEVDELYDIIEQIKTIGYNEYRESLKPKVYPPKMPDLSKINSYESLTKAFHIVQHGHSKDDLWRFSYEIDGYKMYTEWTNKFYDHWDYGKRREYITRFFEAVVLHRPLVKTPPSFVYG